VRKPWSEIEVTACTVLKKHKLKIRTINGKKFIRDGGEEKTFNIKETSF